LKKPTEKMGIQKKVSLSDNTIRFIITNWFFSMEKGDSTNGTSLRKRRATGLEQHSSLYNSTENMAFLRRAKYCWISARRQG